MTYRTLPPKYSPCPMSPYLFFSHLNRPSLLLSCPSIGSQSWNPQSWAQFLPLSLPCLLGHFPISSACICKEVFGYDYIFIDTADTLDALPFVTHRVPVASYWRHLPCRLCFPCTVLCTVPRVGFLGIRDHNQIFLFKIFWTKSILLRMICRAPQEVWGFPFIFLPSLSFPIFVPYAQSLWTTVVFLNSLHFQIFLPLCFLLYLFSLFSFCQPQCHFL